jgi:predicted Fe-S protein YdhL (DUF1289 family)
VITPVDSPCVNICRMDDATGWCTGCLRTLDEIGAWSMLDEDSKRAVWALLPARRDRRSRCAALRPPEEAR